MKERYQIWRIRMTNQQLGAREERVKLLAEIKQAIEKELNK